MNAPALQNDMADIIRNALLPQRFPIRRDVELSARVHSGEGVVSFYDHVWLGRQLLAVAAVQIRGTGIMAVLQAASFRQLLRAALVVLDDPHATLSACRDISKQVDFDAAIVRLDTGSGTLVSATVGDGRVEMINSGNQGGQLSAGDLIWIAVGDIPAPSSAKIPIEGLGHLVDGIIEGNGAACAAALLFKAQGHPSDTATFVVPNDLRVIPRLLGQIAAFFAQHSLTHEDTEGVDVAIDEILTNAIGYAFADGNAHEIYLDLTVEAGELMIEVRDDGVPFDPLGVPAPDLSEDIDLRQPGGLGIHFVNMVMDKVHYRRAAGWNVLTLHKHLKQFAKRQRFES